MNRDLTALPIATGGVLAAVVYAAARVQPDETLVFSFWGALGLPLSISIAAARVSAPTRSRLLFSPVGLLSYYLGVVISIGVSLILFATFSRVQMIPEELLLAIGLLVGSFVSASVFLLAHRHIFGSPTTRDCWQRALLLAIPATGLWVTLFALSPGKFESNLALVLPVQVLFWYIGLGLSAQTSKRVAAA